MHAKYEVSISYDSKVIVKVKVDYRQTNRHTNKQDKNNMTPIFRSWGKIINQKNTWMSACWLWNICLLWNKFWGYTCYLNNDTVACLSLKLYDTPRLVPRTNVLFWGPDDFPVSYSNRDTLWNAWNRHSGSFYGRYGDLVEQYGVTLSRMLNDILTLDQQWPPYRSDLPPISWPLYRAWPSPNYEWFPRSICNGCG